MCDVFICQHPHQNPCSAILNILELLEALARYPYEKCITVKRRRRTRKSFSASGRKSEGWSFVIVSGG